jgi:hypothetical protein
MVELKTKVIGLTIDSSFVQAMPFSKERLDQIGLRALDSFKNVGLRPEQIGLRTADVLFGYELHFSLFGGNAAFRLTGTRVVLNFQNIQSRAGLQSVVETASRAHSLLQETDFLEHAIGVVAHMSFRDEQGHKNAIDVLEDPARNIEFLGRLAHFRIDEWPEVIRIEVDRSLFVSPGLFMAWNSKWRGKVDSETLLQAAKAFEITANRLDFNFEVP